LRVDNLDGFQVLSMLKLDPDTRTTRVVTCTDDEDPEESVGGLADSIDEVLSHKPVLQMN
jgi:CheY-like chemotaxis protein